MPTSFRRLLVSLFGRKVAGLGLGGCKAGGDAGCRVEIVKGGGPLRLRPAVTKLAKKDDGRPF